jgi:hypothetical protein
MLRASPIAPAWTLSRSGKSGNLGDKQLVGKKEQQLNRLQGKVAVITGWSSGMGFAVAGQFVNEGPHVYIHWDGEKDHDAAVAKIGKNIA